MAEDKPTPPVRKLALVAPLTIAILVVVILAAAWFFTRDGGTPAPDTELEQVVVTPARKPVESPLPQQELPLARGDLIEAARAAADAFASGQPRKAAAEKDPLIGRTFRLRIAFGCDAAPLQAGSAQTATVYDPQSRTLRLIAQPGQWSMLPMVQSLSDAARIEAVTGFWLPRPWTHNANCPPKSAQAPPVTPTPPSAETIGLAQIFDMDASRLGRRDQRPYEYVRSIPQENVALLTHSYWLVLEGRLTGFSTGEAVRCHSESSAHHPICIFAVRFDHVTFEDAQSGETLARWDE